MKKNSFYYSCLLLCLSVNAMEKLSPEQSSRKHRRTLSIFSPVHKQENIKELALIKPFFKDKNTISTIATTMDKIEKDKLGYEDYSERTGLIWSDFETTTTEPVKIIKEYDDTEKVTFVRGSLQEQKPQSLLSYPELQEIVCNEILPKTFATIKQWIKLPETVFPQVFFQRCNTSEPMSWHQDLGEEYTPQADYSLVLMLSEQNDPEYGWNGGEFKIRPGLPESKYSEAEVATIIHKYNQGILFNNRINCHGVTEVFPNTEKSKRDIIVIPINLTEMPVKIKK